MSTLLIVFWTFIVFSSIAWYGFLLFYVGFKGGRELISLTRELRTRGAGETRDLAPKDKA